MKLYWSSSHFHDIPFLSIVNLCSYHIHSYIIALTIIICGIRIKCCNVHINIIIIIIIIIIIVNYVNNNFYESCQLVHWCFIMISVMCICINQYSSLIHVICYLQTSMLQCYELISLHMLDHDPVSQNWTPEGRTYGCESDAFGGILYNNNIFWWLLKSQCLCTASPCPLMKFPLFCQQSVLSLNFDNLWKFVVHIPILSETWPSKCMALSKIKLWNHAALDLYGIPEIVLKIWDTHSCICIYYTVSLV